MKYKVNILKLILCSMMLLFQPVRGYAEEYEEYQEDYDNSSDTEENTQEETEYIPEAYYDTIATNEIEGWPAGPMVQAASAIVMDMDTQAVLYGKNLDDTHYPASITKIMTTLIALEHCDLDESFTVGEEVYQIEEDSTNLGIQPGEELTVRQALYGVMLESDNDLANAIAVHTAGSLSAFADMMNEKASQLGCTNTHFVNPSGLHDDSHYTTAGDMALIAQAAYANDKFRSITSATEYVIPATNLVDESRGFLNHQKLLQTDYENYRSWCTGGKTGFTSAAWNTLVTYGEKDGKRLVCILLRENGAERARTETIALMDYGFDSFSHAGTVDAGSIPTFAQIFGMPVGFGILECPNEWKQSVYRVDREGLVSLPDGLAVDDLARSSDGSLISYSYAGWTLGSAEIVFMPLPQNATYSFKQERDMTDALKLAYEKQTQDELTQTAQLAVTQLSEKTDYIYRYIDGYVRKNTVTVALIGVFILAILVILIIILIMRYTREARIQRRRIAEEKARLKAEEEIDRMSAAAIEEQLRGVMKAAEEEKSRRERKQQQFAEAEDELRETEALLDEIYHRAEQGREDK